MPVSSARSLREAAKPFIAQPAANEFIARLGPWHRTACSCGGCYATSLGGHRNTLRLVVCRNARGIIRVRVFETHHDGWAHARNERYYLCPSATQLRVSDRLQIDPDAEEKINVKEYRQAIAELRRYDDTGSDEEGSEGGKGSEVPTRRGRRRRGA